MAENPKGKTIAEIKNFLGRKDFLELLRECDIRRVATDLLREGVIDVGECEIIGQTKGLREAGDNLYMILQKDKTTVKLKALAEVLRDDTTRDIYRQLALMISEFLDKSIPRKEMDDMATEVGSSEERDDISEGTTIVESKAIELTPNEIIQFLDTHKAEYLDHCNVKVIRFPLEKAHVISRGERQQLENALTSAAANDLFYQFLHDNPAPETLVGAAKVLKKDPGTTNMNKRFAKAIEEFLNAN